MADTAIAVTLDQVLELAQRLSPADKARLVERLTPAIVDALARQQKTLRPSMYGILADLGPAPSAEEIDEARREAWASFPREDI